MKKILLAALAASTMFSCNNKEIDGVGKQDSTSSVVIKLEQKDLTKGINDEKKLDEYAVIKSAVIYFIDALGNKVYQRELSADEVTAIANTDITNGGKTIEIAGIPNSSKTLYFVANTKTVASEDLPQIIGLGSDGARLRIDDLQGAAINAPMAGRSDEFTEVTETSFTTSVTISPIVARIEVKKTSCVEETPGAATNIKSYKLSGVFVNYARPSVLIAGTPSDDIPGDIRSHEGWGNDGWKSYLESDNLIFPYFIPSSIPTPTDWKNNTFVDYCTPLKSSLIFYPNVTTGSTDEAPDDSDKSAWAYQVCPAATAADLPHLIFKLTDVEYVSNEFAKAEEYLTVTKYKTIDGDPITAFERGNVYRIEDLTFTHENATPKPYEKNVTVTATVTVKPWKLNMINPDWD